jgi:hypothetical protein
MTLTPERFMKKHLAGLLTCPGAAPSRSLRIGTVAGELPRPFSGLTAAGTVRDFHPVPS